MAADVPVPCATGEVNEDVCPSCGRAELLPPFALSRARLCLACGFIVFPGTSEPAEHVGAPLDT